MLKKIIIPIFILSLFTNAIFLLKTNISNPDEKNFVGYYESQSSFNFNIKKENEIIVDDGNNYINTKLTKINKNTFSFNINNSNNLIFWNGINYIVYITSKDYAITLYKKSEKNIFNTNLKYNKSFRF